MEVKIEESWKKVLHEELSKPYFLALADFVKSEYKSKVCFPRGADIFNAFKLTPFNEVKVVILGQDPYHGPNQAHGLCFSVNDGVPFPPSLRNIFKEINNDLDIAIPTSGNLSRWATQGILLLNATLSVRSGEAGSHQNKGWEQFTDEVIRLLNSKCQNIVFLLWGSFAHNKGKYIDIDRHLVLKAKHPSPLSANQGGWFGQNHFSRTNDYLLQHSKTPINW